MKPNRSLIVHSIFPIKSEESIEEIEIPLNEEITRSIIKRKVVAASNVLVKNILIGGCWTLTDLDKSFKKLMSCVIKNEIRSLLE